MNWYKHDTNATNDAKIKKLILKYGTDGYAIYFHCLELIASDVSENNITFELEHDSEIIADNLKVKSTPDVAAIDRVNEIMRYIVSLNLFHSDNGKIFCFKLLKRLDASMTSSPKFRGFIKKAKENHDNVMINDDEVMQEEIRTEEIRINNIEELKENHAFSCQYFEVIHLDMDKYLNTYNNIDVLNEFKKMEIWLDANPTKRKTNYKKFISGWLGRIKQGEKHHEWSDL